MTILKAALCAAVAVCAAPASAATFTISAGNPAAGSLPAINNGQSNRFFQLDAFVEAASATTFSITLSTFDIACANSEFCTPIYPGGYIRDTVTYDVAAGGAQRLFQFSLPGTRAGGTDIQVLFSTTGSVPISFSNVSSRNTPLVPEPSTWALMLAGFGLTGYALRRRRARVAFA
ncbi:hypothetical protein GCM10011380_00850 [Sphingomonas metalli]|uniref:Ice-binding protein C-terminal domain-containing protein n=1 Tax=Sphingomonas metalli TaxID=1779358 RepID=A0A916SSB4_9SPHN|nr:PEPxxWA-CTERM sorting domain-containing protein [Sphingomonas metalli]GGB15248.1 hypothetical protein GCM10011380_00850 [Sphingomonas metalli]